MAATLEQLLARAEKLEAQMARVNKAIEKAQAQTLIRCTSNVAYGKGCGAEFAINTLEYIQTHWYTEPHGCTGGDYWNQGEGQWKCPNCGHTNRLYQNPEITALKHLFKSVKDVHE